jgi:hypothetical protein
MDAPAFLHDAEAVGAATRRSDSASATAVLKGAISSSLGITQKTFRGDPHG